MSDHKFLNGITIDKCGYYIPKPEIRIFEQRFGRLLAIRPCDKCKKALGSEPRIFINYKMYHPACYQAEEPIAVGIQS